MSTPVGIVLVSHSAELAAGLRLLVGQIGSDAVPVVTAAGTDDGRIGTSYELVLNAIEDADQGAGVVVLPDLGSSVLTTRTVLDDHPRLDVVIVDAPFVEGAVAAVVAAASGADLHTVVKSAEEARHVRKL
ncbi:dihydroxyacetone kinase phosphoryl donor subunit DhaM [Streptomyces sp. MS1.AVA.3]|uniref:dihydroxyacetone kinase phosphoryl donor subunit DhaM n=1 Tax=Streptomyces decoyicus TaxID=249567 RepID=UPI0030C4F71A